ncbi:MAG: hypothetical protein ABI696_03805 [Rubrivivax sp.]
MLTTSIRFPSRLAGLMLLMAAAGSASAIGFGAGPSGAVLGHPLDVTLPLRLDAGETLEPRCVRAQVTIGDRVLPADAVRTRIEPATASRAAQLRVQTIPRVDDAVLTLDLSAGCVGAVTRRYVLFAEPSTVRAEGAASGRPAAGASATAVAPEARAVLRAAPRSAPVADAAAAAPTSPRRATAEARAPRAGTAAALRPPPPSARPRLRLDAMLPAPAAPAGPTLDERTLAVVDEANEAVQVAIAAATAARTRIAGLQGTVSALQRDVAQQREAAMSWQQRAETAEHGSRWLWPLALLTLALLALSAWLWSRLRGLEDARRGAWNGAAAAAAPARPWASASLAAAPVPPPVAPATSPAAAARGLVRAHSPPAAPVAPVAAAARVGAGLAPPHEPRPSELPSLAALPPEAAAADAPVDATLPFLPRQGAHDGRDVSAEELIDLEQQAEFFVVLGQDDAAIELLVAHLRDTGGASPLPYLKLLEIYRRQGDQEAHDRTRERFNRRFNAHAPAWAASAHEGRDLADYPRVLGWLQHVWPRPIDAMAELEALLFRRDGGELFDLPAYRELLFLYALARDRLDPEGGGAPAPLVDVLLPLGPGVSAALGLDAPVPQGRGGSADDDDEPRTTAAGALDPSRQGRAVHPGSSRFGDL